MDLKKEQSKKYFEEAKISLVAAKTLFENAKENDLDLWAHIVKNCYDAIESGICSYLAFKDKVIPIKHPEKVNLFLNNIKIPKKLEKKIYFWLGKRSSAQYVDIKDDKLSVPHELFEERDAEKAIEDSEEVLEFIREQISEASKKF